MIKIAIVCLCFIIVACDGSSDNAGGESDKNNPECVEVSQRTDFVFQDFKSIYQEWKSDINKVDENKNDKYFYAGYQFNELLLSKKIFLQTNYQNLIKLYDEVFIASEAGDLSDKQLKNIYKKLKKSFSNKTQCK